MLQPVEAPIAPDPLARDDARPALPVANVERAGDPFSVTIERNVEDIVRRQGQVRRAATVFQTESYLRAWYANVGRAAGEPLLLSVTDSAGELAAMLPLVRRKVGPLRVVEFADHGVSDGNAPVLGPAVPANVEDAKAMWQAVRAALGADLVRFTKMPPAIEGRANPMTMLPSARPASLTGNMLVIGDSWDDYLASLKGMLRKQLRKTSRLFSENDGATFRRIDDPDEAVKVLDVLARQQSARLRAQGEPYRLDEPEFAAFYRELVAEGVTDGSVVLTALMCQGEVIAALLGLARGDTYVMVRISAANGRWSACSPGRLVIVQTMQMLHAEGFRHFDFSVGDYPYKRRLGARSQPLFDLTEALTWRGLPLLMLDRTKQFVRQRPALLALARRIAKRPKPGIPVTADDRD